MLVDDREVLLAIFRAVAQLYYKVNGKPLEVVVTTVDGSKLCISEGAHPGACTRPSVH